MSSLSSCLSLAKNLTHASLPNNINGSSSPSPPPSLQTDNNDTTKLPMRSRTTPPLPGKKLQPNSQRRRPKQPSVIEIERAIGAGRFRDNEDSGVEEENDAKFDMSMMSFNKFEGAVEKQLRETGEWVTNQTERGFRSNGKNILKFMMLWVLPIWAFSLLVAVGAIKLNIPFLRASPMKMLVLPCQLQRLQLTSVLNSNEMVKSYIPLLSVKFDISLKNVKSFSLIV